MTATGVPPLLAGLCLAALSGAIMKGLAEDLPALLIVWARFSGFVLLMAPVVLWRHGAGRAFRPAMPLAQGVRGLLLVAGTVAFVVATRTLDLAEAITLLYVYPFLIALLAPIALGEPLRPVTLLGIVGGFCGVVLIARPGLDGFAAAGAPLALAAGAMIAGQMILNRRLGVSVDPLLTSFWGACIAALALTPAAPWFWQSVTPGQAARLAAIAALAATGQTLITYAFSRSPAAYLAPFSYMEIVAAVGIGFALFGTLPDALSFLGMAVIIASGVAVARMQQGRITARRQTTP